MALAFELAPPGRVPRLVSCDGAQSVLAQEYAPPPAAKLLYGVRRGDVGVLVCLFCVLLPGLFRCQRSLTSASLFHAHTTHTKTKDVPRPGARARRAAGGAAARHERGRDGRRYFCVLCALLLLPRRVARRPPPHNSNTKKHPKKARTPRWARACATPTSLTPTSPSCCASPLTPPRPRPTRATHCSPTRPPRSGLGTVGGGGDWVHAAKHAKTHTHTT